MELYQEVMVALSESVMKYRVERPLVEKSRYVISGLQKNLVISKTTYRR